MSQHYSASFLEDDPHALPNIETFYLNGARKFRQSQIGCLAGYEPGWYWWSCFPGCLPDGDPYGPFKTEALALADARVE
jgi:hypothetical protein